MKRSPIRPEALGELWALGVVILIALLLFLLIGSYSQLIP